MKAEDHSPVGAEIVARLGDNSLRWLAGQAGLTHATVSRIISGKVRPSPESLVAIAGALRMDPGHLMRLAGIPLPPTQAQLDPEAQYLVQRLSALPAPLRREALSAVAAVIESFWRVAFPQPEAATAGEDELQAAAAALMDAFEDDGIEAVLRDLAARDPAMLQRIRERVAAAPQKPAG